MKKTQSKPIKKASNPTILPTSNKKKKVTPQNGQKQANGKMLASKK